MLSTWPVTSSPKNCWHKSVWPHANTMGRAAGHTLVLKEERKALIRPSLLGLSPQIVAATSCYSEATDVYEQVRVIARPMDGPGIWHKPTGRVHSTRTGRGARVQLSSEKGMLWIAFLDFFVSGAFFFDSFNYRSWSDYIPSISTQQPKKFRVSCPD